MSSETDTTILQRTRALVQKPHVKRTAIGGGVTGVLVVVYQLFVTQSQYEKDKQELIRKASVQWQQIAENDAKITALTLEIERIKVRAEMHRHTN